MTFYDVEGQNARKKQAWKVLASYITDMFGEDGGWKGPDVHDKFTVNSRILLPTREILWFCVAMLGSGEPRSMERANKALEWLSEVGACGAGVHGSFDMHAAINIYKRYYDYISEPVRAMILKGAKELARHSLSPQCAYVGINDNFPSMDCFCALIGGSLVGDMEAVAKGKWMLNELKAMLTRRGMISEYNSPTYTTISVHAMADIYEFSDDAEIKATALACEERIWSDLLCHYHPLICAPAGPHSRTYPVDCAAHEHAGRDVIWVALGDRVAINPLNTSLSTPTGEANEIMHNSVFHLQSNCGWQISGDYHLPEYLAHHALEKTYPYIHTATTECRSRGDISGKYPEFVHPGGDNTTYTYMMPDYALGTALKDFSSGVQTNTFQIIYRKKAEVRQQGDIGTAFTKYFINEKEPLDKDGDGHDSKHHIMDKGRKTCMQHENTAVVMYKSKQWADHDVTDMRLSVLHPDLYGAVEEIRAGGKRVNLNGTFTLFESVDPVNVIIKDGPVYIGYRPLTLTNHGRKAAVKIERKYGNIAVALFNYEGPARDFTATEAFTTQNGFICEIRSTDEISSFEEMEKLLSAYTVEDRVLELDTNTRERYVTVSKPGLEFRCCYSMITEDIKYRTINGTIPESPVFRATGLDETRLPFYNAGWNLSRGL